MPDKLKRAGQDLKNSIEVRDWKAYYVWLEHRRYRVGRTVKVYASDSYNANLYAQEVWGVDHVVRLIGEDNVAKEGEADGR